MVKKTFNGIWVAQKQKGGFAGIPGRAGTYCEQPRHSEYGLDQSVAVQASRTSEGRLKNK